MDRLLIRRSGTGRSRPAPLGPRVTPHPPSSVLRPPSVQLARAAIFVVIALVGVAGILKLAYRSKDLGGGDTSGPAAAVDYGLRLALSDRPAASEYRSEMLHAYQNLDRERTAAENEGLLVPLVKLQAPVPPDSENAAPDYRRLMALIRSKPLGTYGEPPAPPPHTMAEMSVSPGGYGAPKPQGPLYRGIPWEHCPTTDISIVAADIGTKDSSRSQERAVRELLRQRQDVMRLIRKATDKPYCVFARQFSGCQDFLAPENRFMNDAVLLLNAESYLLAKQGRYRAAVADEARALRLAGQAADEPGLDSYEVGVQWERFAIKGMKRILYLAGPNKEVAEMVRHAMTINRPHFSERRAVVGDLSMVSAMFETIRHDPRRIYDLLPTEQDYVNPQLAFFYRSVLRIPGGKELRRRWLAAVEAHVIQVDRVITGDCSLPYPRQAYLSQIGPRIADPIQDTSDRYMVTPDFLSVAIPARAQEAALIAGASVLRYRAIHSRLPAKLSDAGPVPQDPFTGQPMGYARDGDRFVVYSRGESQSFDGRVLLALARAIRHDRSHAPGDPHLTAIRYSLGDYQKEVYFAYPAISGE